MNDMNQIIGLLEAMRHWRLEGYHDKKHGLIYYCTIEDGGHKVEAGGRSSFMAASLALTRLRKARQAKRKTSDKSGSGLKVFGG